MTDQVQRAKWIVHWPGQEVPACDSHAARLKRIAEAMGFNLAASLIIDGELTCTNCENEQKKTVTEVGTKM